MGSAEEKKLDEIISLLRQNITGSGTFRRTTSSVDTGNSSSTGDSGGSVGGDFTSKLSEYGSAISSNIIPSEIFKSFVNELNKVDVASTNVIKSFGVGRENILGIKQAMADSYEQVSLLGFGWDEINQLQITIGESLNRNLVLTSESYAKLLATQEVTGVNADRLATSFKDAGISVYDLTSEMEKVVSSAQNIGVNVGTVSKMVTSNIDLLNKYNFQNGVEGLAKMAALSANLRIDMADVSGAMSKAFEPDSAIEMAAALQRLGVQQSSLLDPLQLLNLSQNNPTELMNQMAEMSKQFMKLNDAGQIEVLPGAKRQLMEIAKAMDIPYDKLVKMGKSSYELSDKLAQISFPEFANEDQKKLIANLSEMSKEKGGYVITFSDKEGKKQEKLVTELSKDEYELLANPPAPKTMEELAQNQLTFLQSIDAGIKSIQGRTGRALATTKGTEQLYTGGKKVSEFVSEATNLPSMSTKQIRETSDEIFTSLGSGLKKIFSGDIQGGLDDASKSGDKFKEHFETIFKEVSEFGKNYKVPEEYKEVFKEVQTFLNGLKGGETTENKEVKPITTENKGTITPVTKVQDFTIQTLPNDKIVMAGGTNLNNEVKVKSYPEDTLSMSNFNKMGQVNSSTINENRTTNDISLNINVNADSRVSKEEIMLMLNKTEVIQELNRQLKMSVSNNGLT